MPLPKPLPDREGPHSDRGVARADFHRGSGTVSALQMTIEAEDVLRAADSLYILHVQHLMVEHLRKEYDSDAVDLTGAYAEDKPRRRTYEEVAEAVIKAATEGGGKHVAYATAGHPLVLSTPSQLIMHEADRQGIPVEVIPGVSSLDTVWADLRFDPGPAGMVMFEATSLVLRQWPLTNTVPLFLWQVNTVETSLYSTHKNKPSRFNRLQDYLLRYYPADHEARLVHSASFPFTEPEIKTVRLGDLGVLAKIATSQHILYVPPVGQQPVADRELAANLSSVDHLETLIERK